jgi:acyl carrier protein
MPELTAPLIEITSETLGLDRERIPASARFVEDLGADSMDCVELMMAVEDAFGIEFPDDDLSELVTIAEVAAYVRRAAAPTVGRGPASRPATGRPAPAIHGVAARYGGGDPRSRFAKAG